MKLPASWDRLEGTLWTAGAIAAAVSVIGLFVDPTQFFRSYLFAYLVCLGIPVGSMAILLIHYLTGGHWGLVLRGTLESVLATLPALVVLFVPLALGLSKLYPWADPEIVAHDPLLQHKSLYLNVPFFLVRAAFYFAAWLWVAWILRSTSAAQVRAWSEARYERMRAFAGPSLALYGLTVTFAAIDWIMSLEPHWFSSIFGALIAIGWVLPAMAFAIVLLTWIAPTAGDAEVEQGPDKNLWNDLGTMLFMFVMLWAYLSFSQLILIWSGNLPEEITWYLHRIEGGWAVFAWALFLFYFAFPFLLLLSRDVKQRPERLGKAAAALLVMHMIYHFWLVRAAPPPEKPGTEHVPVTLDLHWLDATLFIAIVALWGALVVRSLRAGRLFPTEDPAWKEFAAHAAEHADTPGPDEPSAVSIGHEPHRFNVAGVVKAGVALAVISAIAGLVASGIMSALEPAERRVETAGRSVLPQDIGKIRAPVLQDSNADDLIALRKKEAATLAATEWVDRKAGVVRIPIERAMELLVQEKGR